MIAIFEVLQFVIIAALILGVVTQVIVPAMTGKPLFWAFRPKSPESRREQSLKRLKAAEQRLEEAKFRKEAAEKEAEAARLEADEVRLHAEAMHTRIKSAETLFGATEAPADSSPEALAKGEEADDGSTKNNKEEPIGHKD